MELVTVRTIFGNEMKFPLDEIPCLPWHMVAGLTDEEKDALQQLCANASEDKQ